MTNFLGGGSKANTPQPPATQLRIQTSAQGSPIPIGWGQARLSPNILYYTDFTSVPVQNSSGGGKGTGGGSSGKAGGGSDQYNYFWTLIAGLCEGPIDGVLTLFNGKSNITASQLNLAVQVGSYTQTAWSYVTTAHPADARAYRGIAYLFGTGVPGGQNASPEMPNISIEVAFAINTALPGVPTNSNFTGQGAGHPGWGGFDQNGNALPDANPADIIVDFCTNPHYGLGFPGSRIGDSNLSTLRTYATATGMVMSPVLTQQKAANSFLSDLLTGAVAEAVWSGGQIKVVPYWDSSISANGATYTPSLTPIYSLGDDDFIAGGSSSNNYQTAIIVTRKALADRYNHIKIQFNDRNNSYNPSIAEASDEAAIQAWTERVRDTRQLDFFCWAPAAQLCAQLQLGREQVVGTYQFTVGAKYVLLEPMDLVAVSDTSLGLDNQLVRIKEITENEDFSLTIVAEDALVGHASAPQYGTQVSNTAPLNYSLDPGLTNPPFFFEPSAQLVGGAGGLEVMMAVEPQSLSTWGGCNVYVSYDDVNYQYLGQQFGPTRMGVLIAPLAAVTAATTPPTIDTSSTLAVDLTASGGQLTSGTFDDLKGFATLCYVGGEFLAYQNAAPTGANTYNLTTLNRGGYGTAPVSAAAGSTFVRTDAGVFRIPFTQDRIAQTLYIKLVNFNKYGAGPQSLASVSPYTYVIQGAALASPLPSVTNFTTYYESGVLKLTWTEVTDFRPVQYEIRKGSSFAVGQVLGRYAHPGVPTIGDDTYWINSYSQPVAGLQVYGAVPQGLTLVGSVIPANVVASFDEFAGTTSTQGPGGTYGGTAFWNGLFIQNASTNDLLSAPDVLSFDWLSADIGPGTYEIPANHEIDVGRVAPCLVYVQWTFSGVPQSNNFFAYNPLFSITDFFGAASSQLVSVYPEIALSQDGIAWGPWQKYAAGTYQARKFKARMQLQSVDPNVFAFLTSFKFTVYAPTRVDNWGLIGGSRTALNNVALPTAGVSVTFMPDNQSAAPAPFNGGISNPNAPMVLVTILNAQPGDLAVVTNLTLSGCTVQVTNTGVPVARNVNIRPEGY